MEHVERPIHGNKRLKIELQRSLMKIIPVNEALSEEKAALTGWGIQSTATLFEMG